jgi:hypothetical protein
MAKSVLCRLGSHRWGPLERQTMRFANALACDVATSSICRFRRTRCQGGFEARTRTCREAVRVFSFDARPRQRQPTKDRYRYSAHAEIPF